MDTVIVGNGILALTTAFRLARRAGPTDRICVIGPPAREGSATLAAAAMLNSFAELEADSLASEIDQFRFELSRRASKAWPAFGAELVSAVTPAAGLGIDRLGYDTGTYVVNSPGTDDSFDAIVRELVARAEPHALVAPREIPNYAAEERHAATRAVRIHDEGWINPRLVIEHLDRALATFATVERIDGTAVRFRAEQGVVAGVELEGGKIIEGARYLLATGATASGLLDRSDLPLAVQRVFYGIGVSLELRSPDHRHTHCIRTPNRGVACGVYSAPYFQGPTVANDHVLIGATNFISNDPSSYERLASVEVLTRGAVEQINHNFSRADLVRVNVGWRPTTQDTYPLIGKTSFANLVIATGTKRDGFHLAPVLSEHLAALLRDEPASPELDLFRPERAPIRTLTRAQAVDKAVRHQSSDVPASSRMPESVIQMHRDAVERLHDQVGAHDWGIPPEMLDMYRYGHAKP